MVPTGGQYRWASAFAPPRYQQVLSYFTGSLCSIGWQARLTAICHILAGVVLALVEINHDDFSPTRWQRNLLTFGIVVVVSAFNALAASHLSVAEGLFAICHVYALVPIVVSLWVLAPKQSVADVFYNCTDNGGGWPSPVLGVLVGQIPAFFTVLGSEATVHISEEVEEPETVLPRCMLWSYLANLPGTLLLLLTYAFNVSDLEATAEAIVPFASVLSMALQSAAATTGFLVVVMSLLFMIAVSTMVTTSRHLFAFGSVLTTSALSYNADDRQARQSTLFGTVVRKSRRKTASAPQCHLLERILRPRPNPRHYRNDRTAQHYDGIGCCNIDDDLHHCHW